MIALSAADPPLDLNDPSVAFEIKNTLAQLAAREPEVASIAPVMIRTGPYAGSWDAATALEFALFVSRTQGDGLLELSGPFTQLTFPIVGGPQPTARGLELLAGAAEAAGIKMPVFRAWRGGVLDPPSNLSLKEGPIIPSHIDGPVGNQYARLPGDFLPPESIAPLLGQTEDDMLLLWGAIEAAQSGADRDNQLVLALSTLKTREQLVNQALAEGTPNCPAGLQWSPEARRCSKPAELAALQQPSDIAAVAVAGIALGLGAFALYKFWQA